MDVSAERQWLDPNRDKSTPIRTVFEIAGALASDLFFLMNCRHEVSRELMKQDCVRVVMGIEGLLNRLWDAIDSSEAYRLADAANSYPASIGGDLASSYLDHTHTKALFLLQLIEERAGVDSESEDCTFSELTLIASWDAICKVLGDIFGDSLDGLMMQLFKEHNRIKLLPDDILSKLYPLGVTDRIVPSKRNYHRVKNTCPTCGKTMTAGTKQGRTQYVYCKDCGTSDKNTIRE
jgi:hypothetical protein